MSTNACIYIYLYIYIWAGSGFQHPTTQCKRKKKNIYIYIPDVGPSINNKTPCPKPTPRAPLQKKREILFFLRGKIKMLPSHLLILLHPHFCSLFN